MLESSVIFLPCSDIKNTLHFYRDICGLTVHQEQGNGSLYIFDTGYGYIGFCQYADGRKPLSGSKGVCISFNCFNEADVDAHFEKIKAAGAKVIQEPALHTVFPVYSCFFADPDDYRVEFQKIR